MDRSIRLVFKDFAVMILRAFFRLPQCVRVLHQFHLKLLLESCRGLDKLKSATVSRSSAVCYAVYLN